MHSKDVWITPVTEKFVKGKEAMLAYMTCWFGPNKFLKSVNIKFAPEVLTELSADKTWSIADGTGLEHIGTNFLDNPILDEATTAINKMLIIGSLTGLSVGLILGYFIFRKKKS